MEALEVLSSTFCVERSLCSTTFLKNLGSTKFDFDILKENIKRTGDCRGTSSDHMTQGTAVTGLQEKIARMGKADSVVKERYQKQVLLTRFGNR